MHIYRWPVRPGNGRAGLLRSVGLLGAADTGANAPTDPEADADTHAKTPKPTPTAAITEPSTAASPSTVPSASIEPSGSPSAAPSATAIAAPATFQPTQEVAAATDVPAPSAPPPGAPAPPPHRPTFPESVASISEVNADIGPLGASLAVALLLLLIIGFAGELFNNTVENNYDVIAAWFKKSPLGRINGWLARHARIGVLLFIALTAFVSSFVDPTFGFDLRSLAEFLGFLVGLIVVLASFKLPPMLAHRRRTGELGRLRPLPWALVVAGLFVLVSRIGNVQPGYLYGIVLGAIFVTEVSDEEEGRETFLGLDARRGGVRLDRADLGSIARQRRGQLRGDAAVDGVRGDTGRRPRSDRVRPYADAVHARPRGLQVEPARLGSAVRAERVRVHPHPHRPDLGLRLGPLTGRVPRRAGRVCRVWCTLDRDVAVLPIPPHGTRLTSCQLRALPGMRG